MTESPSNPVPAETAMNVALEHDRGIRTAQKVVMTAVMEHRARVDKSCGLLRGALGPNRLPQGSPDEEPPVSTVPGATDPTQIVAIRIMAPDGEEIVPAVGTVYRTSDEAGELTEDLVFVAMTQDQYNRIQGMLVPDTFTNRLDQIVAEAEYHDESFTTDSGEALLQQRSWGKQIAP